MIKRPVEGDRNPALSCRVFYSSQTRHGLSWVKSNQDGVNGGLRRTATAQCRDPKQLVDMLSFTCRFDRVRFSLMS